MTTTYLGQPVQDLTVTEWEPKDFTEHYPQYMNGIDVWQHFGAVQGGLFYQSEWGVYYWCQAIGNVDLHKEWLSKDKLILTDNEQWANDLCAAGYKVGLKTIIIMSAPTPSVEVEDNKEEEVVPTTDELTVEGEDTEVEASTEELPVVPYTNPDSIDYTSYDYNLRMSQLEEEAFDRWEATRDEREQEMLEGYWHEEEVKRERRVHNLNTKHQITLYWQLPLVA